MVCDTWLAGTQIVRENVCGDVYGGKLSGKAHLGEGIDWRQYPDFWVSGMFRLWLAIVDGRYQKA